MANPLRIFRKYEYALLVGFGIMLMFAFVVAPPLSDYLQTRAERTQGGNPVVVTWKGGELKEFDLSNLRTRQLLTTRFLGSLESRVEATEAVPVTRKDEQVSLIKGMTYPYAGAGSDADHARIVVGGEIVEAPVKALRGIVPKVPRIERAMNEEELVERLLLADKARALGVVISDAAIEDYLDNLCDASEANRPDYKAILQSVTNGHLDYKQFMAQMGIELAAQRMEAMAWGGLIAAPPEVLYECYNRLNRHVTAELLAVNVADFVKDVPEPTDADIAALYEQGKDEFPDPLLPDPAFKQRKQIAFGYFQGTFEEFLQREMDAIRPTITDQRIEKYYEDNKATEFKMPELPADEPAQGADTPAAPQPAPDATAPGVTAPGAAPTPPAEGAAPPPVTEPAAPPPTTEPAPPPTTEPATPPTTEPATPPTTEPAAPPTTEPAAPPKSEPAAPPAPAEDQGQKDGSGGESIQLVSYQTQDPAAPPQDQPPQEGAPPAPATPDQPQGPAEPAPAAPAPAAPAPAGETPAADAAVPQADPAAAPGTGDAAAPAAPQTPQAGETPAAPAPQKPVQYKPLDDKLRDEIRTNLARQDARGPAQEKLEKAIDQARAAVERYARQVTRASLSEGAAPPTPPDFAKIAQESNLVHQKTPLWDVLDIVEIRQADPAEGEPPCFDLARATETSFNQQTGMVQRSLAEVAYGEDVAMFLPRRLIDGYSAPEREFAIPPVKLFIYWREQVVPEQVPALEDIRSEVVQAWKLQQALPLARAKAEGMAKQAADAARPLAEVFADNAAQVITTQPFTWMTRGALPGSFQQAPPRLSDVTGTTTGGQRVTISGAGDDFMRAVSDLDAGQVGVAVNQPEKFVYIVRVVSAEPGEQQRRDAFFAAGLTSEMFTLVRAEHNDIRRDWYENLKKELDIDWKRKPERNWRLE